MGFDPQLILEISNYIFYGMMGIVAISGIIGLFTGFWKSLTSFIVSAGCYVLIVLFNSDITKMLFDLDLSMAFEGVTLTINETVLELSTLGNLIKDALIVLLEGQIDVVANPGIVETVEILAMNILSYVIFIILIILAALIVAPLISSLIYNLIIKNIIGAKNEEKTKLPFLGLLTNAVSRLVSLCLVISPLYAITSTASKAFDDYDMNLNETNAKLKECVDAYENSILAQAFSMIDIDGKSLDMAIIDAATSFEVGEGYTSFITDLSMVLDVAAAGIAEGVFNLEDGTFDTTKLLSDVFISKTLTTLASNSLITNLLPVVLSIVTNMDEIKNVVDVSVVDLGDIDWSSELSTLDDIYGQFYDLKMMDLLVNGEDINSYTIDRNDQNGFREVLSNIGSSQVLNAVLPHVISSFAMNIEGDFAGILPTEVSYYQNVDLSNELLSIYDAALSLSDLARYSGVGHNIMIGDLQDEEKINTIVDFILSEDAVNGYRDVEVDGNIQREYFVTTDSVESTGNEPLSLSTNSFFNGVYKTEEVKSLKRQANTLVHRGILDSELLLDNLPALLKSALNIAGFTDLNLDAEIDNFAMEVKTKEGWSSEVNDLLHVVSIVNNNPKLPLENIDLTSVEQIEELKRVCPYIDDSKLIKAIFPKVFKSMMGEQELLFGLTVNDLDLGCDKLGTEISNLLDLALEATDLLEVISGEDALNTMLDPEKFEVGDLKSVLEGVYSSKILNPIPEENKQSNFAMVLNGVLSNESVKELGLNISEELITEIDNEDCAYRKNKASVTSSWLIEINAICGVFESIQNAETIKTAIKGGTLELKDINPDEIETLIISLSDSRLIEPSMGTLLNKYLSSTLESMHLNLDFEMVDDWDIEVKNLKIVLVNLKDFSQNIDLSNLDLSKLNYDNVDGTTGIDDLEEILTSIYRLNSLRYEITEGGYKYQTNYNFADFIYENITSKVLSDYITGSNLQDVLLDHYFEESQIVYKVDVNKVYVSWDVESSDYHGEIHNIIELIRYIVTAEDSLGNSMFFDDSGNLNLNSVLDDPSVLNTLVSKINNIYAFRSILPEILDSQVNQNANIQIDGIDLTKVNTNIFKKQFNHRYNQGDVDYVSKDRHQEILDREYELSLLCDILVNIEEISSVLSSGNVDLASFKPLLQSDGASNSILANLFNDLYYSNLFNTKKTSSQYTTLFEDIIKLVLDKSTLSSLIYDENYDTGSQDNKVLSIIKDITNKNVENVSWITKDGVKGQLDLFINLLSEVCNIDGLTSIENVKSISSDSLKSILRKINECYLTHDALSNEVGKMMKEASLDDYVLSDTPMISGHYIDSLGLSFAETVSLWNNDIDRLVNLYELIKDGFDSLIVEENGNKTVRDGLFSELLPNLGQIKTLELQRSDILYSIFDKCSISSFVSEYGSASSASFRKRDLIKLITSMHVNTNADFVREGKYLDILVNSLLEHKDANFNFDDGVNHITPNQVNDIFACVYTYDESISVNSSNASLNDYETRYERGYYSSEIIASFLETMIDDLGQGNIILPDFRANYTYLGLNEVEREGLTGILELTEGLIEYNDACGNEQDGYKNFAGFDYNAWENKMKHALTLMGTSESFELAPRERQLYLRLNPSNTNTYGDNAIIAERMYNFLVSTRHEQIDDIEDSVVKDLLIYNATTGSNIKESDVIIHWELTSFAKEKDEWFISKTPFKLMHDIVVAIN